MQPEWLIIDGYNLLHKVEKLVPMLRNDLSLARQRLVRMIENTAHRMATQTTIVFDGRESGIDESLTVKHIEVYFSPGNLSADTIIERLVSKYERPEKILVVTSDHAEHATVSSAGAQVMSSQEFIAQCRLDERKSMEKRTPPGREPRLGDLFPDHW
ncbi:MAG: NYN domain-containing protein [Pontiellaceae bacterium]|nr:NYN domain-containing protein [Pontiellaceae bacterium]MBN2786390.1 NYN domain-containing protein [Pontiellaceae bacterium]